ncbi:element excision factor XisH family protein [Nostoc sp.]|uniref:element excision factor XisH family protein n=1 Tax=Nostoc sp. TaxID=1180 RepID=UPI003FA5299A
MSAKDIFHNAVRLALEKDNWNITHDPLSITIDAFLLFGVVVFKIYSLNHIYNFLLMFFQPI